MNRLPTMSERLLRKMEQRMVLYVKTGMPVPYELRQQYNALVEKVNAKVNAESIREHKAYLSTLSPEQLLEIAKKLKQ